MEKTEAIREAVEQFRKQGIDLSNIDITGGEGRKQLIDAIQVIQNTAIHSDEARQAKLLMALSEVQSVCDKTHVSSRRNLLIMEEEGGLNALLWHLDSHEHDAVLVRVLQVLLELCSQQGKLCSTEDNDSIDKFVLDTLQSPLVIYLNREDHRSWCRLCVVCWGNRKKRQNHSHCLLHWGKL